MCHLSPDHPDLEHPDTELDPAGDKVSQCRESSGIFQQALRGKPVNLTLRKVAI